MCAIYQLVNVIDETCVTLCSRRVKWGGANALQLGLICLLGGRILSVNWRFCEADPGLAVYSGFDDR
jgi:hypothetical protein